MWLYLVHYCVLFSSRVRVRFSVWLVSCYAHVFVLLQVAMVTLGSSRHVRLCRASRASRDERVERVEPVEFDMSSESSRAVRQARYSQNAWARHVERRSTRSTKSNVSSSVETSQVEFGPISGRSRRSPTIATSSAEWFRSVSCSAFSSRWSSVAGGTSSTRSRGQPTSPYSSPPTFRSISFYGLGLRPILYTGPVCDDNASESTRLIVTRLD